MLLDMPRAVVAGVVGQRLERLMAAGSPRAFARMWGFLERVSKDPRHLRNARRYRWLVEQGHPFGKWLERISKELSPKARACFIRNVYGNAWFLGRPARRRFERRHGYRPPDLLVFDVTARCNLKCRGCWAAMYAGGQDLPRELLERALDEAEREMRVHFFVFTGGEPTLREDLWEVARAHPDSQFMLYSNGVLIDQAMARTMASLGNVMPMVSIEGDRALTDARRGEGAYDRAIRAMDHLRHEGVLFGFSATATRDNVDSILSEDFIRLMVEHGCLYGWYFQYIPIGREPDVRLMVSAEQRQKMRRRVGELRSAHPIFLSDFWNDGPEVNGCMAGGRRYLHVTNEGEIEPCVFCHFAVANLRETALTEALKHPLFRAIRRGVPYDGNLLRPCMLIDRPWVFRQYARAYGARPTHPGAELLIGELADALDEKARAWARLADPAWRREGGTPMYPFPPGQEPDYIHPRRLRQLAD